MKKTLASIVLFVLVSPVAALLIIACFGGIVTLYCARYIGFDEDNQIVYVFLGQLSWSAFLIILAFAM